MPQRPLQIDWDDVLPGSDHGPPPELVVVPSAASAAGSGDGGAEEPGFVVAELDDHQLQDRVQRMAVHLSSGLAVRLPDKGAKLRATLRLMQDELDRRKLAGSRKDVAGFGRIAETKNSQSQDSVDDPKANAKESQSLVHCSFSSKLLQKIEGKEDDASSKGLIAIIPNQVSSSDKKELVVDEKKHKIGISPLTDKFLPGESSFRCVSSLANKHLQKSSNGFIKDAINANTSFVEGKNLSSSKRTDVHPDMKNSTS